MDPKVFPLRDVLTITTGMLLTDVSNLYIILGYMAGGSPLTHQLPMLADKCGPVLMETYPELRKVERHVCSLHKGVELTRYANGDVDEYIARWVNMCAKDCGLQMEYAVPKLTVGGIENV